MWQNSGNWSGAHTLCNRNIKIWWGTGTLQRGNKHKHFILVYILHNIHVKFSTFNHFCSSEIGEQFCKSLSSMLTEESGVSTENQAAKEVIFNSKNMYQTEGSLGSVWNIVRNIFGGVPPAFFQLCHFRNKDPRQHFFQLCHFKTKMTRMIKTYGLIWCEL